MNTINISLPDQLKTDADLLIRKGYFASFSDLARTAIRKIISESEYDILAKQAIAEHKQRKSTVLKTKKDIDRYVDALTGS